MVAIVVLGRSPLAAQLAPIGVPKGQIRISVGGEWHAADDRFLDGKKQDYLADFGSPALGSDRFSFLTIVDTGVARILGQSSYHLDLGKQTAHGLFTIGTANIGLAVGLTHKLTLFVNVPIVETRVQAKLNLDSTSADAGVNPAYQGLGTPEGQLAASTFFTQFSTALDDLNSKILAGDYDGDAALKQLAQNTYADGIVVRDRLSALSFDQATASPFIPTSSSVTGQAIASRIQALQNTLSASLGVAGFSAAPVLADSRLGSTDIETFSSDPSGPIQGFPFQEARISRIGDVQAGAAYSLIDHWDRDSALGGIRAVAEARMTFPSGTADDPNNFLDIGTGNKRFEVGLALTADLGWHRWGARLSGSYLNRLPNNLIRRVSSPSQPIAGIDRLARVRIDAGDVISFSAQPYYRLVRNIAITAGVQYWRQGADAADYLATSDEIPGVSASLLAEDSKRSATLLRGGVTYVGRAAQECKAGKCGFPIDATLSYERVIAASGGRVSAEGVTRVEIRFYRRLW